MLYVDVPSVAELRRLAAMRAEPSVSLYVATTPLTAEIGPARTRLGQLLQEAVAQMEAIGTPKRTIWPIEDQVKDLIDDDAFWERQARGLAVLVTAARHHCFRLPTTLVETAQVSDRFHLKPLLRAASVPLHGYVLALEENRVRVVEVTADLPPEEVKVPGMPKDAASAVGTSNINSRNPSGRIQGSEGQNLRLRQFARKVDEALAPLLKGREDPLILAAASPTAEIFRSVSTHPGLAAEGIGGSPATMSLHELGEAARGILDRLHEARLEEFRRRFDRMAGAGRASSDIAMVARAATMGAVDTLLVDIDHAIPGTIDETSGEVTFAEGESGASYGVVDEIAGRVLASDGRVLGVRRADIPGGADLAAILRWAV